MKAFASCGLLPPTKECSAATPKPAGEAPIDVVLDNFEVSAPAAVPEPSSIALIALAGVGLLAQRLRGIRQRR